MSAPIFIAVAAVPAVMLLFVWVRWRTAVRAEYIRGYVFPPGLFDKLRARRPELSLKDCQLVSRALRQFFLAHLKSGRKFVSMPSQVADDLWHEMILYTRAYDTFCRKAFGSFLHHTPAVVLGSDRSDNTGLRRTWWYCCKEENINPRNATRLPLLFALDAKLNITNGFRYVPDCGALRPGETGTAYCGADFSSSSFDGGTDGFADSPSSSGDGGGGDSSGCGGGGD